MRELHLERKSIDLLEYKARTANINDVSTVIKDDVIIYADGEPVILYKNLDIDTSAIRWAVKNIPYDFGKRTRGLKSQSKIFGYSPRIPIRRNWCSTTSLAETHPKQHRAITDFAKELTDYYETYFPHIFQKHQAIIKENVLEDWVIAGSPFTSGIVNKNNQLKYHFDSGNFKDVLSNMIVFKKGTDGGYLIIPEFDIALEVSDKSLTIFNGQDILHGVSDIEYTNETGYRYSVVYYALQQFWKCKAIDEEIIHARNHKSSKEYLRIDPENILKLEKEYEIMKRAEDLLIEKRNLNKI
jgi:hypothetical protein